MTRAFDLVTGVIVLAALYGALIWAPAERVQGDTQRIMYVHVPMAWMTYVAFTVVLVASILFLWKRSEAADRIARAAGEVGVLFATLMLITGSIWGRAVWGVWWTWDARLTSTLVLWFVYVGYLMVRSAIVEPERAARIAAVVGIVGFVNVPIVQLSVTWWRTLHPQPSVTQPGALAAEMWVVLLLSALAFLLVLARLILLRFDLLRAQGEARDVALGLAT